MLRDQLIEYSEQVINGDIIACLKTQVVMSAFLFDLEREGTEEFPYIFDEERGERFLDWMRLFKHRKGVLAGKYIEPHIIQQFIFGNIYGWIHKDTGLRRFKKGYWQVARKNAKSQSLGGVGSYEASAFGEPSAEVYCAATKKDQAKLVWEEIEGMIMGNAELKDRFRVAYGTITHLKSGSIIKPLSKEDRKTGDGTNPSAFIVDEYHAHETSEIYDIGDSGMGARSQPLMMIITTAGFNLNNPCYRVEYKYVSDVIDPNSPKENEEYFVMINELDKDDDIKDESVWPKANPIICSYENGINYLRSQLKVALDVPEKMRNFLTKNMNVWVDAKDDGYMPMNKWNDEDLIKVREDIKQYPCYVGGDLSTTTDLTSIGMVFVLPDRFHIKQLSFIPGDKLQERMATDDVPYSLWIEQGHLIETPGATVDYDYIKQTILDMRNEGYQIKELGFDKWNATHLMQQMENEGFVTLEVPQTILTLTAPTKGLRTQVFEKKITHENDPVLNWAMGNAVQRQDAQENIMIDKRKSTERIDPVAAVINAYYRAMNHDINDVSNHFLNGWSM